LSYLSDVKMYTGLWLIQHFSALLPHGCFVDEVAGHSSQFCSIL